MPRPASAAILAVVLALAPAGRGAEGPSLRIAFGERSVVFSGAVDSEETAEALLLATRGARPDLSTDRSALVVDPSAATPPMRDLRSLLAELALSTHEGRLELWPDRVVVGGLTDSLVTQSALRLRAEAILAGRAYENRLCIVDSDALPRFEVSLADGRKVAPTPDAAAPALRETPFSRPGLPLEKLLATRRLLGQIDFLAGRAAPREPGPEMVEAATEGTAPTEAAPPPMPLTAVPIDTWTALSPVFFSRNTFLLQENQGEALDAIAKELLSPARRGAPVRVEAVKASGGSGAFNEYLCERRAAEVLRFLSERGVEPEFVTTGTIESPSPIDLGEVRVLVDRLPEPEPAPEAAPEAKPESKAESKAESKPAGPAEAAP